MSKCNNEAPFDIATEFAKCKLQGLCEREHIANAFLVSRIEQLNTLRQINNEIIRKRTGLPPCPPICPDIKEIEHV